MQTVIINDKANKKAIVGMSLNRDDVFSQEFIEFVDNSFFNIILKSYHEDLSPEQTEEMLFNGVFRGIEVTVRRLCCKRACYWLSKEHNEELYDKLVELNETIYNAADESESGNE